MVKAVRFQLTEAMGAILDGNDARARKVVERDDALDNLRALVESRVHAAIAEPSLGESERRWLRGLLRIAGNLEKIGDYAENIARQAAHRPSDPDVWRKVLTALDAQGGGGLAEKIMEEAIRAFLDLDLERASRVSRLESALDDCYGSAIQAGIGLVQAEPALAPSVVTGLAVLKYLERIGDAALNMAESVVTAATGERLKLDQYMQLTGLLESAGDPNAAFSFESVWEGISGARLGRVSLASGETLIFKEGNARKISEEISKHAAWTEIAPDLLVPIRAHRVEDGRGAFLDAFVGETLVDRLRRTGPLEEKIEVAARLFRTLEGLWNRTLTPRPPVSSFAAHVRDRLPELWAAHPEIKPLRDRPVRLDNRAIPSLDGILDALSVLEEKWAPPFSVWIHGDLNVDNVLVEDPGPSFRLIDIHRAGPGDYLLDLSVLAISFIRHPAFQDDPNASSYVSAVHRFAEDQARLRGDAAAPFRWKLALGRSFITSARLVLDDRLARRWFLKGLSLLEDLLDGHPDDARVSDASAQQPVGSA